MKVNTTNIGMFPNMLKQQSLDNNYHSNVVQVIDLLLLLQITEYTICRDKNNNRACIVTASYKGNTTKFKVHFNGLKNIITQVNKYAMELKLG